MAPQHVTVPGAAAYGDIGFAAVHGVGAAVGNTRERLAHLEAGVRETSVRLRHPMNASLDLSPAASRRPTTEPPMRARVGARTVLLIFAFWLCLPGAGAAMFLLFAQGISIGDTVKFVEASFIHSIVWTPVTTLAFWLTAGWSDEGTNRVARGFVLLGVGIVISFLVSVVVAAAFRMAGVAQTSLSATRSLPLFNEAFRMQPVSTGFFVGSAFAGLLRDASHHARMRRDEAIRLQSQLAEARLKVLHTQLNPHFLFNTLNAVSALMDEDTRGARRMIARLSELLRYVLDDATSPEIPLGDELKLVGRYLEIVQIRYQGSLETCIQMEPDIGGALVPSLILQPLAENAMKHGVANVGGRGRIEVEAHRAGDRLVMQVSDTGGGSSSAELLRSTEARRGGLGLRHTRERLEQLYGADQQLTLQRRGDGGTIALIDIPYHTAPVTGITPRAKPV
jgi:sensor histidine kinase YesM